MINKPDYSWAAVFREAVWSDTAVPGFKAIDMAYAKLAYNSSKKEQIKEFDPKDYEFKRELVLITKYNESPDLMRETNHQSIYQRRSKYYSKNLRSTNKLNTRTGLNKLSIDTMATSDQSGAFNLTRAI